MSLLDRAVRTGIRRGLRDGLFGDSQLWLTLGAVALGVRAMQRLGARKAVVVTEQLRPGDTIVVRHLAPGEQ